MLARCSLLGGLVTAAALAAAAPVSDAGSTARPDAGADAGLDAGRPALASWVAFDGGERFDGGVTDYITLSPDASIEVRLPQHVVDLLCDEPLVQVEVRPQSFLFTGVTAGVTHCGFWYSPGLPSRYMELEVVP